jgi:ribonuclease D
VISTASQLEEFLPKLKSFDRVAVDTEADSLHSYFEKLCLLQMSFGGEDYLIDTLEGFDLAPWQMRWRKRKLFCRAQTSICD